MVIDLLELTDSWFLIHFVKILEYDAHNSALDDKRFMAGYQVVVNFESDTMRRRATLGASLLNTTLSPEQGHPKLALEQDGIVILMQPSDRRPMLRAA